MAAPTIDEILSHHGVKGMRWGVRKRRSPEDLSGPPEEVSIARVKTPRGERIKTAGGRRQPASEDSVKAAVARRKLQESGIQSLSNQELRSLTERMELVSKVSKMDLGKKSAGQKFVNEVIKQGPSLVSAAKIMNAGNNDPKVKVGLTVAEEILKVAARGRK